MSGEIPEHLRQRQRDVPIDRSKLCRHDSDDERVACTRCGGSGRLRDSELEADPEQVRHYHGRPIPRNFKFDRDGNHISGYPV